MPSLDKIMINNIEYDFLSDPFEIGDVRFSTRFSLGEKYLMPDGSSFSMSEYPDYLEYLTPSGADKYNSFISNTDLRPYECDAGDYIFTFAGSGGQIGYTNKNTGIIKTITLSEVTRICSIDYVNGKYLITYLYNTGTQSDIRKYEILPEEKTLTNYAKIGVTVTSGRPKIMYLNNKYICYGDSGKYKTSDEKYALLYYSDDLMNWTSKTVFSNCKGQYGQCCLLNIIQKDDNYVWVLLEMMDDSTITYSTCHLIKMPIVDLFNTTQNFYTSYLYYTLPEYYGSSSTTLSAPKFLMCSSFGNTFYILYTTCKYNYFYYNAIKVTDNNASISAAPIDLSALGITIGTSIKDSISLNVGKINGIIHILSADKKLYKLDNGTLTQITTLDSSIAPSAYPAFPIDTLSSFGNYFMFASGANTAINWYNQLPVITPPSGINAFIKVK